MEISPINTLLLAIAPGVGGAVAVVVFQSVTADVAGGVVVLMALAAVIRSAIQLAGEIGTPDDEPASQRS